MEPINFSEILKQLQQDLLIHAQSAGKGYVKQAENDAQKMLNSIEEKLKRWTIELSIGQISKDDFAWLVYSQVELTEMFALKEAGLGEIEIDKFKKDVVDIIVKVVFQVLKMV